MICKNCGNQLDEGLRFCGVCGAKVEAEDLFSSTPGAVTENALPDEPEISDVNAADENNGFSIDASVAENQPDYDFFTQPDEPVKKRKKWPIVVTIIGVLVAVLVALGIVFWDSVMALWMHMQPAEKQLQYTYYRFSAKTTSSAADDYQKSLDNYAKPMSTKGSITLEIDGIAKEFIGQQLGTQVANISQVSIDYAIDYKDAKYSVDATLKAGGKALFDVTCYVNIEDSEIIIDAPAILDAPVRVEIPESQGNTSMSALSSVESELITSLLPDAELIEKVIPRLVEAAFREIDDVSSESEDIEAGNVSVDANCLEAKISEKTIVKMGVAALEELENNEDFKAYVEKLVGNIEDNSEKLGIEDFDSDDAIDSIYDGLKEARKALKQVDASSKELFSIKTYVDFHYNILGIVAEVEDADVSAGFLAINHGGKLGYEIYAERDGDRLFEIVGNGKKNGDIYSVKFELNFAVNGQKCVNIATLDVKDFDTKALAEGQLRGSFELFVSDTVLDELDISGANLLSPSLKVTFDGKPNESSKCTISLNAGGKSVVSLIFDSTISDQANVKVPQGAVDSDEIEINENAVEDLINEIEDLGLPLEDIISGLGDNDLYEDGDYYDDYYDDDYYDDYYDDDYYDDYDFDDYDDDSLTEEEQAELESFWSEY